MKRKVNRSGGGVNRGNKAGTASIPAPVGGLNARDAIANMPETDALTLDNWFPQPNSVSVRNGYSNWVTGLPGWVETLMHYNGPSSKELFAASVSGVYDVTLTGAVGAAVVSGLSNARFQYVNFTTSGGNFLTAVNGVDAPLLYNGSTWTNPTITGVTASTFVHVNSFKNRLWYVERASTRIWYLPLNSIQGAATVLDLGPIFQLGGYLNCMVSWTIDNSAGVDDYAAFISSEGEVALYRGTDPTYASTWALTGTFRIGRPVGRRCYQKYGQDVILITADGVFPISQALTSMEQEQAAISYKITNLINNDVQAYSSNFGWQPILYPIGNKLIVNVPQVENTTQYQYVMNTITNAWCRFTGWNAACWEIFNDSIYFGGSTVVCLADSGSNDNGANINAIGKPAFSYFGSHEQKIFTLCRPIFTTNGSLTAALALCVDFNDLQPVNVPVYSGGSGATWDISPWDTTPWGGANNTVTQWQTVTGVGFSASLKVQVYAKNISVVWASTDYVYESGGAL